jgi:predicted permease
VLSFLRSVQLRIWALWRRKQLERDLEDELAYHLEQRRANGDCVVPFGNATSIREQTRDQWTFIALDNLWRDVRQAMRALAHAPGHTLLIILLLAIGIGANSAIFSIAYPVLLDELPVPEPERLVRMVPALRTTDAAAGDWSIPLFRTFRERFQSAEVAGFLGAESPRAQEPGSEDLAGLATTMVSGNYFRVIGTQAEIGRALTPDDDAYTDARTVFLLSHAAWERELGGDREAIGKQFPLFGRSFTLVGVLPREFRGMGGDVWVPMGLQPIVVPGPDRRLDWGNFSTAVIARLKPDVSEAQAQAEASVVWSSFSEQERGRRTELRLEPGNRGFGDLRARFAPALQVLSVGVAMLLLTACANVASMLLARAGAREKEIAVRQAIGCGRWRLMRQFIVENLILAGFGAALGLVFAVAGARGLVAMAAPDALAGVEPGLDTSVVLFTLGISVASAMLFGLVPAWRASHVSIEAALRSGTRGTTASPARQRLNRSWVVAQTVFSTVLVVVATLFGQSLYRLYVLDAGFQREQVITATVNARALGFKGNPDPQYATVAARLVERLETLPGISSASVTGTGFLQGSSRTTFFQVEGHESPLGRENAPPAQPPMRVNQATWKFLDTLGVALVAGRGFTDRDRAEAPAVAIVNQSFARMYFRGASAVGKRLWRDRQRMQAVEIVGVVRDSKYNNLREQATPLVFLPLEQDPRNFNHVQLRTQGPAEAMVEVIRAAILQVDPRLAPTQVETLKASLDRTLARDILLARLSGLFGGMALLVACFGVYGMTSYVVTSRTKEIGVRLAIGARPGQVLRQVVADALKTAALGIVVGVAGAVAMERVIASLLFGAGSSDAPVYAAVAVCLATATMLAACGPARRASRIDPVGALRAE